MKRENWSKKNRTKKSTKEVRAKAKAISCTGKTARCVRIKGKEREKKNDRTEHGN